MSVFIVLLTVFLTLLLTTSVSIISYTYYETSRAFLESADTQIDMIARDAIKSTTSMLDQTMKLAQSKGWMLAGKNKNILQDPDLETSILSGLTFQDNFTAYFVADENGNVLNIGRIISSQEYVTEKIPVPDDAAYMIRKIHRSEGNNFESRVYLTKKAISVGEERIPESLMRYDARARPWYMSLKKEKKPRWTDVYLYENNEIGISATVPVLNNKNEMWGAVTIDIGMAQISAMLSRLKVAQNGVPVILTESGEIIGHPDSRKTSRRVGDHVVIGHVQDTGQVQLSEAFSMFKKTGKKNFIFKVNEEVYIASFMPFPEGYGTGWMMGVVVPQNDFVGPLKQARENTILISLAIILLALISVVLFSRRISVPIRQLAEDMYRVGNFDIDSDLEIHTKLKEISMIADGLRVMKEGLRSFSHYIPKDLVRQLVATGHTAELSGEKKKLTILFSDIENFTAVSEKLASEKLLRHMSTYLDRLSQLVLSNKGTIDKYIGDSIMAFWGAPLVDDKQVYNACYSVLRCLREVNELNHMWMAQGLPLFPTRFGLNTDEVVVGNMGSAERLNYTIIGDGVNLASRLEGASKEYGTYALVSHSVYKEAKEDFVFRPIDIVAVKGKKEGIAVYELCGMHAGEFRCDDAELSYYALFFEAFDLYQQRHWKRALKIYKELMKVLPNDRVTKIYIERCMGYIKSPPPDDWDGIHRLTYK